jgi:dihydroorotase
MSRVLLRLPRPDDWHLHVRDGAGMISLMASAPRVMARAIIMPNLKPPVRTTGEALAYRARILAALPAGSDFEPLMTLYLTDNTSAEEITAAHAAGIVAVKYYPAGATTNSDAGVTDLFKALPALLRMEALGMPLLMHGEVTQPSVDIFEKEPVFVREVLAPLVARCPGLRIVLEHITTKEAVAFVEAGGDNIAATITAHHLMYNRNGARGAALRPRAPICLKQSRRAPSSPFSAARSAL